METLQWNYSSNDYGLPIVKVFDTFHKTWAIDIQRFSTVGYLIINPENWST